MADKANTELMKSWARSEALLRQARAALPEGVEHEFRESLEQFEEFLAHNELGLALDTLVGVVDEIGSVTADVRAPLLEAARNMGRR